MMSTHNSETEVATPTLFSKMMRFWMTQKLLVFIGLIGLIAVGLVVAPFDWNVPLLPRDPVPVDAIPDIGENQQIVFTNWIGRSPKDVEDQITYPLTIALLGIPGVKAIRSYSYFSFSSIYVVFEDKIDFYWSRTRILERLSSLQPGTLPAGVQPVLGPDATAVGQVFWYTVEGKGFSLDELRTIQDWYVRYYLESAKGVSEVASVGGYVKEYQVDVNPNAMRAAGVVLQDVYTAVQRSNLDVGARTIELNNVDYIIRGLGWIGSTKDLENAVVKMTRNIPIRVKDVAKVSLGPAFREGALNKGGAEAAGGVVVVRFAENPLQVIKNVKAKIKEIAPFLPKKTLPDGTVSQVKIVPFYDRTQLIHETLGTLKNALSDETLVAIIVVIVMVNNLISSALISLVLPLAVLMTFIIMKAFGVDANLMALSGIAIAIGVMVDMGIILCENILRHIEHDPPGKSSFQIIHEAATEVGGAVITSASTTIIAFLPVFTLTGPEGKLFKPVAFTKTFAIAASLGTGPFRYTSPGPHLVHQEEPESENADHRVRSGDNRGFGNRVLGIVAHWLRGDAHGSREAGFALFTAGDTKQGLDGHEPDRLSFGRVPAHGTLDASRLGKRTVQEHGFRRGNHFPAFGVQQARHHLLPSCLGLGFGT